MNGFCPPLRTLDVQRPFIVYAPVQTDKTSESMVEAAKELRGILGERPITSDEVEKAQKNQTLTLAGRWETNNAVEGSIGQIVQYGLPDDYFDTYTQRVRALNRDQVSEAAHEVVHPDNLVWIIVGDRSIIEPKIRALNLGQIFLMDSDGNVIEGGTQ